MQIHADKLHQLARAIGRTLLVPPQQFTNFCCQKISVVTIYNCLFHLFFFLNYFVIILDYMYFVFEILGVTYFIVFDFLRDVPPGKSTYWLTEKNFRFVCHLSKVITSCPFLSPHGQVNKTEWILGLG